MLGKERVLRIQKQAIRDAWRKFREEEQQTVRQLPQEITSQFGQLGFGKYGHRWLPMLAISPYDVDEEWIRGEWHVHWEKVGSRMQREDTI